MRGYGFQFTPVVHWVKIVVFKKGYGSEVIKTIIWDGLPFPLRTKWDWYFKYRAALEQVNNPRSHVHFTWGNTPAEGKPLTQQLKDRLTSRKALVTKTENAIRKYENANQKLLIWEKETDEMYQKALEKLSNYRDEMHEAEQELNHAQNKHNEQQK